MPIRQYRAQKSRVFKKRKEKLNHIKRNKSNRKTRVQNENPKSESSMSLPLEPPVGVSPGRSLHQVSLWVASGASGWVWTSSFFEGKCLWRICFPPLGPRPAPQQREKSREARREGRGPRREGRGGLGLGWAAAGGGKGACVRVCVCVCFCTSGLPIQKKWNYTFFPHFLT